MASCHIPAAPFDESTISTSGTGGTIQATAAGTMTLSGAIANAGTTLTLITNTGNITASGVISGAGAVTKTGASTLSLSNTASTYTGQTSINAGILNVASLAMLALTARLAQALAHQLLISGYWCAAIYRLGFTINKSRHQFNW